ncbi:TatD family hydrolase [bacterium]|nr:TatD family hydrolase [bacterium]
MSMWIDTHAHLDMAAFNDDLDSVLKRAEDEGVKRIITIGIDIESSRKALELAEKHLNVFASVGIHPHEAGKASEEDLETLIGLLAHPKCVALGEAGLDYHYDYSPRDVQHSIFKTQLRLANALKKPLIIHVREAMEDALNIIDSVSTQQWNGVFHCYGGEAYEVPEVIKRGFHIGFTGVVTFKNFKNADTVRQVPINRLLVETDAPYMAPTPFRGKRSEPMHVATTGTALAELLEMDVDILAAQTSRNAKSLFRLTVD